MSERKIDIKDKSEDSKKFKFQLIGSVVVGTMLAGATVNTINQGVEAITHPNPETTKTINNTKYNAEPPSKEGFANYMQANKKATERADSQKAAYENGGGTFMSDTPADEQARKDAGSDETDKVLREFDQWSEEQLATPTDEPPTNPTVGP